LIAAARLVDGGSFYLVARLSYLVSGREWIQAARLLDGLWFSRVMLL
jgi:hypothetical protein